MDYIKITGLKIFAHHGVLPEEKKNGQDFYINARLFYSMKQPGKTDDLNYAINYAQVCAFMTETFTAQSFDLIEAAAEHLCHAVLLEFSTLEKIELELCKPHAPIGLPFTDVSVNMTRQWHKTFVAVGSNMGDSGKLIAEGLKELESCPDIRGFKKSSLIVTKPYGPVEQPDFLNGCVSFETLLDPEELLVLLHEIEAHANRERKIHWGPRTLDLDLLFYDDQVLGTKRLIVPHPEIEKRSFVLVPMAQIAPWLRHPVSKSTIKQLLEELNAEQ